MGIARGIAWREVSSLVISLRLSPVDVESLQMKWWFFALPL